LIETDNRTDKLQKTAQYTGYESYFILWCFGKPSEQLADLGNNQRVWLCCHNFFKIP
jgi:hypothetical protein